ncbi:hypothetical protein Tco_0728070 [Tanacetum coccineum]|uniref:Uncharacterized protein n=1 Tax=Tanacetum coccineum TaxID=301880 RepID=A0ABQ4YK50_9ASTR
MRMTIKHAYVKKELTSGPAWDNTLHYTYNIRDLLGTYDASSIWEAFGGYTRDLDSIWEETGQDCSFTRSGFKDARIVPGDGVTIPSDAIRTYKRRRQEICNCVRM